MTERPSGGNRKGTREDFGSLRQLNSKRWQARYTGPDGHQHKAPLTYTSKTNARAFLARTRTEIETGTWISPDVVRSPQKAPETVATYSKTWLAGRVLKPTTVQHYESLLRTQLLPRWGDVRLADVTPTDVKAWHATDMAGVGKTRRAHAYSLLRTILGTAVEDGLLAANPVHIRGAGSTHTAKRIETATASQVAAMIDAVPPRYRALIALAAWCGLRFGEATELRRSDIDTTHGIVKVRRAVSLVSGRHVVGTPKTNAGIRDVVMPPHIRDLVREHLLAYCQPGPDGLLFSGSRSTEWLSPSSVERVLRPAARGANWAGTFHGLRHTGLTLAAQTGATLAELMNRAGHSSPAAALRYQHVAQGRDLEIATKMSELSG